MEIVLAGLGIGLLELGLGVVIMALFDVPSQLSSSGTKLMLEIASVLNMVMTVVAFFAGNPNLGWALMVAWGVILGFSLGRASFEPHPDRANARGAAREARARVRSAVMVRFPSECRWKG